MYGALWRMLPGPSWVKVILFVILLAAVVVALFTWVFPYVQELIGVQEVTVGDDS